MVVCEHGDGDRGEHRGRARIKVADIVVTDDALGSNVLSLSGADAASFSIVNGAGAVLQRRGARLRDEGRLCRDGRRRRRRGWRRPDATQSFTLDITDVNEAPTAVIVANTTTAIEENTDTSARLKVADIVVTDDALGAENLALVGADACFFEIVGTSCG